MFDRTTVCMLADITTEEYDYIIHNYSELLKIYNESLNKEEPSDKGKFMKLYNEVNDKKVAFGFEGNIIEIGNRMSNSKFNQSDKIIIDYKLFSYVEEFLDFCLENEIQEFYVTQKVFESCSIMIFSALDIFDLKYNYDGITFERFENETTELLFKFKRTEVE